MKRVLLEAFCFALLLVSSAAFAQNIVIFSDNGFPAADSAGSAGRLGIRISRDGDLKARAERVGITLTQIFSFRSVVGDFEIQKNWFTSGES